MSAVRHKPADPLRRLMSAVYEGVILFGVVFFFAYAFSSLTSFKGGEGPLRTAFQLYLFLVLGTYFTWFWSRGRRTLPMKTMGVVLVRARDDAPLTPGRAAWRYLVASIMFWGLLAAVWKASVWWLPLWPLPFAWSMFNPRRQTLYDLVAGTVLVEQAPAAGHRPRAGAVGKSSSAGAEAGAPLRSSIDPAAR
jgi:uncharacterized RDD family membrane protein YckC